MGATALPGVMKSKRNDLQNRGVHICAERREANRSGVSAIDAPRPSAHPIESGGATAQLVGLNAMMPNKYAWLPFNEVIPKIAPSKSDWTCCPVRRVFAWFKSAKRE